ncbi:hypothetical protein ASE04_05235 [Rhizobium sp. Root708]|uniref:ACT domain-containing protein n=1 Tax=Rhizobium sp. Root708 TaxID=1736592 RepID=UPI0006F33C9C|nr:ACT domain-containing protein [Rhizobium sp. Root708]KRB55119.1 hypothetical protein ASE04_05235 [Rhizobium sp. Root708]
MSGVTDLQTLLATLEPKLLQGEFVFAAAPPDSMEACILLKPLGVFAEAEGLTVILPTDVGAKTGWPLSSPCRCISMTVHSSLEAVGLTAAMAGALAAQGISANVIAGYYHDHIFVPAKDAERAIATLRALAQDAAATR